MKKRLFVMLVAAIAMLLTSCGIVQRMVMPEKTIAPSRGYWDGNTFVSAYFGLCFDVPNHWTVMSDEDKTRMRLEYGVFFPQISAGAAITPDMYKYFEAMRFVDMMAEYWDGESEIIVHMVIVGLPANAPDMTSAELQPFWAEILSLHYLSEYVVMHDDTVRIGSLDWYVIEQRIVNSGDVFDMHFLNIDGRFIRYITIGYLHVEDLENTIALFRPY